MERRLEKWGMVYLAEASFPNHFQKLKIGYGELFILEERKKKNISNVLNIIIMGKKRRKMIIDL